MAGKRQTSLDVAQAAVYYERALELTPADHPERSTILREDTELRWRSGRVSVDDAITAYEEAMNLALANDDTGGGGFVLRRLYFQLGFRGDSEAARAALERGIDLLERPASLRRCWPSCTRRSPRTRCSPAGPRGRSGGPLARSSSPIRTASRS